MNITGQYETIYLSVTILRKSSIRRKTNKTGKLNFQSYLW